MTQPQQQLLKLTVKPGTFAAVRRQELDNASFIDIRNLAYLAYKNPDQTPLMTYAETLDHRGMVKQKILQFEVASGWITPDGSETQPFSDANPNANNGATMSQQPPMMPPGVPMMPQQPQQMQMPMMPQQQMPQQQMMPPGVGLPGVPSMPAYAPPMQAAPPPSMHPQMASPAQAAEAAAQPATPGKRRGRGSQVAAPPPPPPGAPPPMQQQMAPPQQQMMPPPQQMMMPPVPVQNFPQQQQQMAPPQAGGVDSKLVADLGRGLEVLSKNNMELSAKLDYALKEMADTKMMLAQAFTAIHHLYLGSSAGQSTAGQANTLQDFQKFLERYMGNLGKPNPK